MLNKLKDYSIVYSFDRTGFERHARSFEPINQAALAQKHYLVTGGTSGIGAALADQLADAGAIVTVTGRNQDKFERSPLADKGVKFLALDMADLQAVREAPLQQLAPFDGLVCNAGGMPDELQLVNEQYDQIFASQVIGHYLLIRRFIERQLLKPHGVVHITSSGGMYLQKLDLSDLCWQRKKYDKVRSYANAKRAQVILNQELARLYPTHNFQCSHPGWVATAALTDALPGFSQRLGDRLRNSQQGADTMLWCLAESARLPSGKFWFDREARNEYPFFWTRESTAQRKQLLKLCQQAWQEN